MANKNNLFGEIPSEMYHNVKFELTESEDSDEPNIDDIQGYESEPNSVPLFDKKRLYEAPDFAFVVYNSSMKAFLKELDSLIELKGCYYEIFDR